MASNQAVAGEAADPGRLQSIPPRNLLCAMRGATVESVAVAAVVAAHYAVSARAVSHARLGQPPRGRIRWMTANRNAVVSPNRIMPSRACNAPMSNHWSGRVTFELPKVVMAEREYSMANFMLGS